MIPDSFFFITMTISLKVCYHKLYINIVTNYVMIYYVYYALINSPVVSLILNQLTLTFITTEFGGRKQVE